jgi:hypothetical protein
MESIKQKKIILLGLGMISPLTLFTSQVKASSFGAEIFCSMRDGGNDHESSWEAAYSYIKKQKGGLFKISPRQAASLITETVIREGEKFSYCVEYLDKLHPNRRLEQKERKRKKLQKELEKTNEEFSGETFDRYSY